MTFFDAILFRQEPRRRARHANKPRRQNRGPRQNRLLAAEPLESRWLLSASASQPETISIADVVQAKADTPQSTFAFTVSLSAASTLPVSVDYSTSDGTAKTSASDYLPTIGTLTFQPGKTTETIPVTVDDNSAVGAAKTFFVNLANAVNATIPATESRGVGIILNNPTAGTSYYINDGSTTGDIYTTAVGNDSNSGESPSQPMASLNALTTKYQLGARIK